MFRRVEVRIWNDEKFQDLSDRAKLMWLHLLTGPQTTNLPIAQVTTREALASFSGIGGGPEGASEALGEVLRRGLALADWSRRMVLLPHAYRYNPAESGNTVKGWVKRLDELPRCPLTVEAWKLTIAEAERALARAKGKDKRTFEGALEDLREGLERASEGPRDTGAVPGTGKKQFQEPPPLPAAEISREGAEVEEKAGGGGGGSANLSADDAWKALTANRERRGLEPEPKPRDFAKWWLGVSQLPGIIRAHARWLSDRDFAVKRWPFPVFRTPTVYETRLDGDSVLPRCELSDCGQERSETERLCEAHADKWWRACLADNVGGTTDETRALHLTQWIANQSQ